jgi:hypothetical protein
MSSLSSHLTQQICDYLVHSKCLNLQSQNRREELLVRQDWSGGVGEWYIPIFGPTLGETNDGMS